MPGTKALPARQALLLLGAAFLLLGYGAFLLRHRSFAAGGADSSGYLNSARGLAEGDIVRPVETLSRLGLPADMAPLLIPLGYRPGPAPGTMSPEYPPGLPLHMVATAAAFGPRLGPFLVSPLSALGCLLLLYLLGRELGLERGYALAGSAILALFPTFVFQAVQPMSDVLAACWAIAAVLAALRSRKQPRFAIAAGAAFGIGVLVRPTNALLLAPLFLALPAVWRQRRLFLFGLTPFVACLLAYNTIAYGSPLESGYTHAWREFSPVHFLPRFLHYARWTASLLTPLVPLLWLASGTDGRLPRRDRALLFYWFAVFLLFYSFYLPYDAWWYTRFLLPGVPAVILGALLSARRLLAHPALPRPAAALLGGGALLFVLMRGAAFVLRNQAHAIAKGDEIYAEACRLAATELPPKSLVLAMQMSGALEHDTDIPYVMWNWILPGQFPPRLAQSAAANGYRWFALLAPFELEEARARLPGRWTELGRAGDVGLWKIE